MKSSKISLSYIFEYYLPHFKDKDTLPVPILLSETLGIDWVYFTRPIGHINAYQSGLPIVLVGRPQAKKNVDLLLQNKETECTFSNWFMLESTCLAAFSSNILMTGHWSGRTGISALVFKVICFFLCKPSFVYIKMDTDVNTIQRLAARGRLRSSFVDKIKFWAAFFPALVAIDFFSAESPEAVAEMQKSFPQLREKVTLLRNCPSASLLGNNDIRLGDVRQKQILAVGRLGTYQKATDVLLEGFRQFHKLFPEWRLVLVGAKNADLNRLLSENKDLCHSGAVVYLGHIADKQKLREIFLQSAIYVQPSRYEGASIALIEACSFGCVPICTPVGSAKDVLGDYFEHLTVAVDDADGLARKLGVLAAQPQVLATASDYLFARSAEFRWDVQLQPVVERIRTHFQLPSECTP